MYDKPISYSGRSLYKKCPKAWHNAYILGNRGKTNAASERGTELHNILEEFFLEKIPYPSGNKTLRPWQRFMENLAATGKAIPEGEVAVLKDWTPTSFDDPNAYYRGKKDLDIAEGTHIDIFDWKSGKMYPDHPEQGFDYAALSPQFESYSTHFVYLDIPLHVETRTYTWPEVEARRRHLDTVIEVIRLDEEWPPTPSENACKWCDLSWRRGGSCDKAP